MCGGDGPHKHHTNTNKYTHTRTYTNGTVVSGGGRNTLYQPKIMSMALFTRPVLRFGIGGLSTTSVGLSELW